MVENNDSYELKYQRFREAREKTLELVETFEGDIGWSVIRDVKSGEIFDCRYKVKPGQEMNFDALKRERQMNKRLKQYLQEKGIVMIVENPGELITYNEMEKS